MAIAPWTVYAYAMLEMSQKKIDLTASDGATFVMVLTTATYAPGFNTDSTWANASAFELPTGGGYTAGGMVLTGLSDTVGGGVVTWTSASPSWPAFSATFKYPIIVRRAGASLASTDLLIAYFDVNQGGGSVTGGGGTLTITQNASGIFTMSHNP